MILRGTSPYIYLTWTWHMIPSSWGPFLLTLFFVRVLTQAWRLCERSDVLERNRFFSHAAGAPQRGQMLENVRNTMWQMKYISDWNCRNLKAIFFWKISSLAWRAMRQLEIHLDSSRCTLWHRCLALFSGSISSFQGATRFVWICLKYPG